MLGGVGRLFLDGMMAIGIRKGDLLLQIKEVGETGYEEYKRRVKRVVEIYVAQNSRREKDGPMTTSQPQIL